jgi:hypothetical protein
MEQNPIIEKVQSLMDGEKSHRQSRIVEIETAEGKRRGLLRGYIPEDDVILFSWILELDPGKKRIGYIDMEMVTILCEYKPSEILSIN